MKFLYKIFLVVLLIAGSTISCKKNVLDLEPLDQYGQEAVWGDLGLMQTFVNNIYYGIYHGFDGKIGMQMLTDEAMRVSDRGASNVTNSLVSPSDYSVFGSQVGQIKLTWDPLYRSIRSCNVFLDQVKKHSYDDNVLRQQLTGEVHFLRAYNYHTLAFMYGGVPIIKTPYGLNDKVEVARNSFEETIQFIAQECDSAAALLPLAHSAANNGRATKGAALALKSRVLLYAASELYNNAAWATGYAKPELVSYTKGTRAARWQEAKDAAKAVVNLNRYSLYKATPAPGEDIAGNYSSMFLLKQTSEDIFVRFFTQVSMETSEIYHPGLHNSPGGYHGHGSNNPTGQAVDDYYMRDGTKFDWNNAVHKTNPYLNREPRFYASILYDGALWAKRPVDVQPLDPIGMIQTGSYENANGTLRPGLDTRQSPIEGFNGTGSGYYQRKQIDPSYPFQYQVQESPWRHIRYTEVLLNYIEASNETGDDAEARRYLNMIRTRAGLPDISTGGSQLRESIRHERRIELMFEGQRYFDIRRWMIAPKVMVNAMGIDIRYKFGQTVPIYTPLRVQNRSWRDRSYFMPIRLEEMNKNKLLMQNPLY